MNDWEYLVDTIVIDAEQQKHKGGSTGSSPTSDVILSQRLNVWGGKGWELVAFLPALPAPDLPKSSCVLHAILKRKKNASATVD